MRSRLLVAPLLQPCLAVVLAVVLAGAAARPAEPDPREPAAPAAAPTAVGWWNRPTVGSATTRWAWPLSPVPSVLARFDPPSSAWAAGHRGVDLAATVGEPVLAPADGVVTFRGVVAGRGVVVVSHAGGLRSTFEPVDWPGPPARTVGGQVIEGQVVVGEQVAVGQRIGAVSPAPGHCAPVTCLHWGVLEGEVYLDPLTFVRPVRVVLLPMG